MRRNTYDIATDFLKERVNLAFGELRKQYSKANPYRQEPVEPKQRLYDYSQITPEQIVFAKQQFGPEIVDKYLTDMEALRQRYQGGQ